ncbi:hypothetical protein ONZ45_g1830 [Pleurotus djamor]|nr:hypothetical protein ONZ45_g1830 [Pleurotus djamor]
MQFITYVLIGISAMTFTLAAPMEANVDEQDKGNLFLPIILHRPQVVQPAVPSVSGNTNNQGAINSGSGLAAGGSGAGNIGGGGGSATAGSASAFDGSINRFGNVG